MQYKTILLALLQERQELHERLRQERRLLPALNLYANELRTCHLAWKERLAAARPASADSQIASEALELALQELEERLPAASPTEECPRPSVAEAMAYLRSRMPTA